MNLEVLRDALDQHKSRLSYLSRSTGISRERLLSLTKGMEPTLHEWRSLAKALKISSRALLSDDEAQARYSFIFRSPVNGKQVSRALLSQLSKKMILSDELSPQFSSSRVASVRAALLPHVNYLDAEANARLFRTMFLGNNQSRPLLDLPAIIASALGVRIFLIDTPGIEGASVIAADDAFIFLARRFAPRMLFTLAHELAHVLFHQSGDSDFMSLGFDSKDRASEVLSKSASKDEMFAHAFASALLMPDAAVGRLLKKLREHSKFEGPLGDIEINFIARFFGVSFLAAAVRCESLKLLPRGGAVSLDESVRTEYGSAEKRAVELKLPERQPINFPYFPEDLLAAAIEKIREGSLSIGRASAELGITVEDLVSANEQLIH